MSLLKLKERRKRGLESETKAVNMFDPAVLKSASSGYMGNCTS